MEYFCCIYERVGLAPEFFLEFVGNPVRSGVDSAEMDKMAIEGRTALTQLTSFKYVIHKYVIK